MLAGVVAFNEAGVSALVFYLAAYALMNLPAFAVITVRERETEFGDDIRSVEGLGRDRPALAGVLTVSMLALAGLPGTAGFIGKLFLIESAVDGDYTWLAVMIAIGTMISLAYYLRVIAAIWMKPSASAAEPPAAPVPVIAGASQEADRRWPLITAIAVFGAAATVFFGVIPSPLVDWAANAGEAIASVFV
jgi:NADH-quinone oxidoreductase subunit N